MEQIYLGTIFNGEKILACCRDDGLYELPTIDGYDLDAREYNLDYLGISIHGLQGFDSKHGQHRCFAFEYIYGELKTGRYNSFRWLSRDELRSVAWTQESEQFTERIDTAMKKDKYTIFKNDGRDIFDLSGPELFKLNPPLEVLYSNECMRMELDQKCMSLVEQDIHRLKKAHHIWHILALDSNGKVVFLEQCF